MKKFLKVFIIILLVLAVIGGTVFFFFRKHKQENAETGSIINFVSSESKVKLNDKLLTIDNDIVGKDEADNRMDVLIATSNKLDEIMVVLVSYYANSNTSISNKEIKNKMMELSSKNNRIIRMAEEYCIKSGYYLDEHGEVKFKATEFNEHLGLNDLYQAMCSYLVEYAELVNLLNNTLNVDKNSDIKFNMFNIYANIVKNTFSETIGSTKDKTRVQIENASNIHKINQILMIKNLNVVKLIDSSDPDKGCSLLTGANNNEFNSYYNSCDKELFAKDFAFNLSSSEPAITNEQKAIKFLKLIYGI